MTLAGELSVKVTRWLLARGNARTSDEEELFCVTPYLHKVRLLWQSEQGWPPSHRRFRDLQRSHACNTLRRFALPFAAGCCEGFTPAIDMIRVNAPQSPLIGKIFSRGSEKQSGMEKIKSFFDLGLGVKRKQQRPHFFASATTLGPFWHRLVEELR